MRPALRKLVVGGVRVGDEADLLRLEGRQRVAQHGAQGSSLPERVIIGAMSVKPRIGARIAATTGAFWRGGATPPSAGRARLPRLHPTEWGIWVAILVFAYGRGGASEVALVAVLQLAPAAVVAPSRPRSGPVSANGSADRVPAPGGGCRCYRGFLVADAPVAIVYTPRRAANVSITLDPSGAGRDPPLALAHPGGAWTAANVAAGSIETTAILIGPAVAGVVLRPRPRPGLRRSVRALAGGAILVAGLPRPSPPIGVPQLASAPSSVRRWPASRCSPARSGRARWWCCSAPASVLWGALDVLLVVLALDALSMGQSGVGFLNAAIGAGGIVGAMLAAS